MIAADSQNLGCHLSGIGVKRIWPKRNRVLKTFGAVGEFETT